jgi:tetratricopeptide (TPR) repeat protein
MKTYTEPELRTLIAQTEMRFRDASDEEVLNVFPDALPEEIQRAYDRYSEIFHPPYYAANRYGDVKDALKGIVDRLNDAYHNLLERASVQQPFLPEDPQQAAALLPKEEQAAGQEPEEAAAPAEPIESMPAEMLEDELRRDPGNTAAMRALGHRLQKTGRAREGEKHLLRALELEPQNTESHFALAEFYQAQGLKFKAFRHLNIVLQIDPQNQKAMDALGIKKRRGGLYEITH